MDTKSYSIALSVLVIASLVVGGASLTVATSSAPSTAAEGELKQETTVQNETDGQPLDLSRLSVTALEAAQLAQNETSGKVLAVRLKTVNGTPGYEVLVTNQQGNVTGVVVNAEQPAILETQENIAQLNATVLQEQGVNISDIHGAVAVIQAAQQKVGPEFIPVEVSIEAERGFVGQQVTFISPNATQAVVVDLTNDPVIGVSAPAPRQGTDGPQTQATQTVVAETTQAEEAAETTQTTETANATTTAAAAMGAGSASAVQEGAEDDEFGEEFGNADEYVGPMIGAYNNDILAANDEFDTTDEYGFFTGGEEEEGEGGLFGGEGEEEAEGGAFLGEEAEGGGWF